MRIRTIKPEFWKSERMCGLGAETRLLAIGLLNYADDEGYFLAHPALIRGELMPFAEGTGSIQGMLDELVEIEFLRIGEDAAKRKIGLVVNFKKHQRVDRPQPSKLRGNVEFPNGSPTIPGILAEGSTNDQGLIDENSTKDRGGLAVGMEGNGMEKEGIREGSGKPSPDKPGDLVVLAASSIPEGKSAICNAEIVEVVAANGHGESDSVIPDPAESAKKKEGGAAGATLNAEHPTLNIEGRRPEVGAGRKKSQKGAKKEEGPEWPEDFPVEYREVLLPWWLHKREQRQGYKSIGWLTLCARERGFPVAQVKASVEASMANNWAGLFTMNTVVGQPTGRGEFGAKKGGGAVEQIVVENTSAPDGFEQGCAALYGAVTPWAMLGEGQQGEVREWLRMNVKGGLPPCDWQLVWAEVYGPLPAPETWAGVHDVARKQILARIEAKKKGGRGE